MAPFDQSQNVSIKITSRGRYAVTALLDLTQAQTKAPVPLSEIAHQSRISLSYLEQLFAALRKHGIVRSVRGPGGGYKLAKPANAIFIADILNAAEDTVSARKNNAQDAAMKNHPKTDPLWEQAGHLLYLTFSGISLQDVLNGTLQTHPHLTKIFECLR